MSEKEESTWTWPLRMALTTYCFRASILSSSVCFSRAPIHSSNRSHDSSFSGMLLRKSWQMKRGARFGLSVLHNVLVSLSSPCLFYLEEPALLSPQAMPLSGASSKHCEVIIWGTTRYRTMDLPFSSKCWGNLMHRFLLESGITDIQGLISIKKSLN